MAKTIQNIIKIGNSAAVTIPSKEFKRLGLSHGGKVAVDFESADIPDAHTLEVIAIAQKLIKRHQKALDNLSQR